MTTDVLTAGVGGAPPVPRWRPSRAGLVALWRYWDETFTFHHGRLLLRGPNGSGKSMALELLLPFLLDADASPHRLTSASKSRGGLFERVMTGSDESSRTGFAWIEFVRGDEAFTVGVRLRTSQSTRKVDFGYFTTSQRVGVDLQLLGPGRVPLSRRELEAAIGEHGRVRASADDHRAAVRTTLFPGFGADRYASVVTALLALRREKLSQNLDLPKLSEVLSEALAPIDEHNLTTVAEGFERLDRRQAELVRLEAEVKEVRLLGGRQRDYARAVLRELTTVVRAAETRHDDVRRDERLAAESLERSRQRSQELADEQEAVTARLAAVGVERDALRDRDAYREGAGLQDLHDQVRRLEQAVDAARRARDRFRTAYEGAGLAVDRAKQGAEEAAGNAERAWDDLERGATLVGAEAVTVEARAMAVAGPGPTAVDQANGLLTAWVERREALVAEVRAALVAHAAAVQARDFAATRLEEDREVLADRVRAVTTAREDLARALATFADDVGSWLGSLRAVDPERAAAAVPRPWTPPEVAHAVSTLHSALDREHEAVLAGLRTRQQDLREQRADVQAERDAHAEGQVVEPPAPAWRSARASRPGAPLWRLVEVAEGVPGAAIDGLEAALTATGLVDAWVHPDGRVDLADHPDDIALGVRSAAGSSLADVLVALDHPEVPPAVVVGVLASVAVTATAGRTGAGADPAGQAGVEPEVVLGRDGTFRLGPASGRGPTRPATLLGAEARERRRLERLRELDEALAGLDRRLETIDREIDDRSLRHAAARGELDARPDGADVRRAEQAAAAAEVRRTEADDGVTRSKSRLEAAERVTRDTLRLLMTAGALHSLPTQPEALDAVASALVSVRQQLATWSRRTGELHRATRRLEDEQARLTSASEDVAEGDEALRVATGHATDAKGRLARLETSVGAAYTEIVAALEQLEAERARLETRRRTLTTEIPRLAKVTGSLETALARVEHDRVEAVEHRQRSQQRLVAALRDGLGTDAAVAEPPSLEGVTAVLQASRELSQELGAATDTREVEQAGARLTDRLHRSRELVGARADLDRRLTADGWWVLSALVAGLRRGVTELVSALENELAAGRQEFAEEEKELFEQVLAGSVRRALADRIRLANGLVDDINAQLDRVRTAAGGMAVRLRWDVDPDQLDAVRSARALLLREPDDLTEAEGSALQDFVRARVEQARAELEASAPWEARLRETLDYRTWHRFSLLIAHRDWDGYQPATAARLQRLSTGERSIALHLPMMASLAAHYTDDAGQPSGCPRLVLLDELFAGVDPVNRAQLFGTFTTWDLDALFTSDHEWCQYASLDGIAIHHLHPPVGDEPVTSTRFTWDGRRRVVDPVP